MRNLLITFALMTASMSVARAEMPPEPAASRQAVAGGAETSTAELDEVLKAAGCDPAAIADPRFVADAKNAMRPLIHEEDAGAMLTNKKHVVMAYTALLILLVGFVVVLGLRQQRLSAEIQRLAADLDRALKDERA